MGRQVLQRRLQASGTTMTSEIIEVKKQRAAELLLETDKSVVEIATAVGFTNSTSFARAFKSWTEESPREYRKKRRGHVNETNSP
jgi:AraC-like DNA-binding protein